jgi:hypothetical protein
MKQWSTVIYVFSLTKMSFLFNERDSIVGVRSCCESVITRGGQSYFKSNGNEALTDDFFFINDDEALNAGGKIKAMKRLTPMKI